MEEEIVGQRERSESNFSLLEWNFSAAEGWSPAITHYSLPQSPAEFNKRRAEEKKSKTFTFIISSNLVAIEKEFIFCKSERRWRRPLR
eukprot:UN13445